MRRHLNFSETFSSTCTFDIVDLLFSASGATIGRSYLEMESAIILSLREMKIIRRLSQHIPRNLDRHVTNMINNSLESQFLLLIAVISIRVNHCVSLIVHVYDFFNLGSKRDEEHKVVKLHHL
jgi:hypothetical protein